MCCLCLLCMGAEGGLLLALRSTPTSNDVGNGGVCIWRCGGPCDPLTMAIRWVCCWRSGGRRGSTTSATLLALWSMSRFNDGHNGQRNQLCCLDLLRAHARANTVSRSSHVIGVPPAQQHPATLSLAAPRRPLSQHTPIPPQSTPAISTPPPSIPPAPT